jgi:single-stranded DNA-binding protein
LALVEGRLQTRDWQTKTGDKRSTTEIIAERIQFGPRSSSGGEAISNKESSEEKDRLPEINIEEPEIKVEDIPF